MYGGGVCVRARVCVCVLGDAPTRHSSRGRQHPAAGRQGRAGGQMGRPDRFQAGPSGLGKARHSRCAMCVWWLSALSSQ